MVSKMRQDEEVEVTCVQILECSPRADRALRVSSYVAVVAMKREGGEENWQWVHSNVVSCVTHFRCQCLSYLAFHAIKSRVFDKSCIIGQSKIKKNH